MLVFLLVGTVMPSPLGSRIRMILFVWNSVCRMFNAYYNMFITYVICLFYNVY